MADDLLRDGPHLLTTLAVAGLVIVALFLFNETSLFFILLAGMCHTYNLQ